MCITFLCAYMQINWKSYFFIWNPMKHKEDPRVPVATWSTCFLSFFRLVMLNSSHFFFFFLFFLDDVMAIWPHSAASSLLWLFCLIMILVCVLETERRRASLNKKKVWFDSDHQSFIAFLVFCICKPTLWYIIQKHLIWGFPHALLFNLHII